MALSHRDNIWCKKGNKREEEKKVASGRGSATLEPAYTNILEEKLWL